MVREKFDDGEEKIINLRPYIGKGFPSICLTTKTKNKYVIEPGGGIGWENGYDFTNYLKELASRRTRGMTMQPPFTDSSLIVGGHRGTERRAN